MTTKIVLMLVLCLSLLSFSNAYITITNVAVALNTYPYGAQYYIFQIGSKDVYYFFDDHIFFGYDASYLSPIAVYPETFPYFPLGYASYDFYVGFQWERLRITALHNCTHQFLSASMELPWHDGSFNAITFEIIF